MKRRQMLGRQLFLAATVVAIGIVVLQVLHGPIAVYVRIAAAIMLAISAWLLFGNLTTRRQRDKDITQPKKQHSNRLRIPMLATGIGSMLLALLIIFAEFEYMNLTSSGSAALMEYVIALLFCGGFALAGWAILRARPKR